MCLIYNKSQHTPIKFSIYSVRFYGEPKLKKPKELQGIKQVFSVDYISNKCKCQVFVKDNDVWVKHRDYFSSPIMVEFEDIGTPLSYRAKKYLGKDISRKFVYSDSWGSIILRNEAWLLIKNLYAQIKEGRFVLDIIKDIREQQEQHHSFKPFDLACTDMERMWEKIVSQLDNLIL